MSLVVQKFGGSSVANADRIMNVAKIVTDAYAQDQSVVVVVSAQGDTTDDLILKAHEINKRPSKREMDVLLSTGEQISIALLAMAIEKLGYPVRSLTGWQAGFLTNSTYSNARIRKINTERLRNELDKGNIVIVAGFQGINRYDDITTLGRGGSDTSAVALAAALRADLCQIYTDVDGVYTADPRKVPGAKKLDEITYDEMLELASAGAQVLHNRSVEMAKKFHVKLEVLSSLEKKPGTKVKEVISMEKMLIRGVAKDDNVFRMTIKGVPNVPGISYKIFSLLAAKKLNVDIILQSVSSNNKCDINFTVDQTSKDAAIDAANEVIQIIGAEGLEYDENVSKVSAVGSGMVAHPGVAAKVFGALADANINIQLISTSEIKISVLIASEDADRAVKAIHNAFDFNS